jgi:hypothetical protein
MIHQRQRHLYQDALRLADQNDGFNFPVNLGVRPADPYSQLEDQTSLWSFGNIAQGHWVALVPLNDQNDIRRRGQYESGLHLS